MSYLLTCGFSVQSQVFISTLNYRINLYLGLEVEAKVVTEVGQVAKAPEMKVRAIDLLHWKKSKLQKLIVENVKMMTMNEMADAVAKMMATKTITERASPVLDQAPSI